MAGNPLVSQGTLNRLVASVVVPSFPDLNVTASYLGKSGISVSLQGNATAMLATMTGAATSPEPYMMALIRVTLLKTQSLSALWKTQMETTTLIGPVTVYPDSSALPIYTFDNCAIEGVGDMLLNGSTPDWGLTITGVYQINASLYNGT